MSRGYLFFIFLVLAAFVAYWAYFPVKSTIALTLSPQSGSGEFGTAMIRDEAGRSRVIVEVLNEPDNASQPMHFHNGSCKRLGSVVYNLNPLVNGRSETILNVSTADLKARLPLAINAHKSADESNIYVACGDVPK